MSTYNHFLGSSVKNSGPADNFKAVNPNNTTNLPFTTAAIYVGGEGDLAVRCELSGETVVFRSLPAGSFLPIETLRVLSTGTTATNLVALG